MADDVPGFMRRHRLKLIASVVITLGIVYTATRGGLKLVPDGGDFSAVEWWAVPAYIPLLVGVMWFRSVRMRFLLRSIAHVPQRRLFAVSCVGSGAVLLLPFRLGELVRPYLLRTPPSRRVTGEPALTMTSATSAAVVERIFDGLFLALGLAAVLVAVPTLDPLPERVAGLPISIASVRAAASAMLVIFGAGFATIVVFYVARGWARRATQAVIGKVSHRLADKLAGFAEKLADGLHVLARPRDAAGFIVETSLYWALNIFGMWVLARGCGVALSLGEAAGCMGLLGCAIMVPGPPGLLGLFQVGMYAAMTMYLPADIVLGAGAAYVFLLYLIQLIVQLVFAAWGVWHEGGTERLRGSLGPLGREA